MKILVTGATGLLGTDIVYNLEKAGHQVLKGCFSDRGTGYIAADIKTEAGIKKLDAESWNFVVHASASKNPDECEVEQDDAYKVNVWAAEQIAKVAFQRSANMLFISTDYVFSGEKPPYSETDIKDPINYYGKTKDLAEGKILDTLPEACILRVPILYGIRAGLKASDLLNSSLEKINTLEEAIIDDYVVRYPTYTGDVAGVVKFLINKQLKGIYHFSGQDKLTKYSALKILADILNKKSDHILPFNEMPESNARRPIDSHLGMDKLLSLGYGYPLSFTERILRIVNGNKNILYLLKDLW
jgi:S-adenosylmethionine synthetase